MLDLADVVSNKMQVTDHEVNANNRCRWIDIKQEVLMGKGAPLVHTSTTADSINEFVSGCIGYLFSLHPSLANAGGTKQTPSTSFSNHHNTCAISKGGV